MSTQVPRPELSAPTEPPFGMADFLRLLDKRRALIRNITLLTVAVTAAVMFSMPTLYSTSAVVMLDQRKNAVADQSSVLSAFPTDPSSVQNQIQVLSSRDLALKVIDKLQLAGDPEFNPQLGGGGFSLRSLLRPPASMRPDEARDAVASAFLSKLDVSSLGLSTSIQVGFTSRDPEKAARIANALAKSYTEDQVAVKRDAARKAAAWLTERMHQLSQQMQSQEAAVQLYKAEHDLVEGADGKSLVDEQLVAINTQLINARSDLAEKRAAYERVSALAKTGNAAAITPVVNSKMIGDLRAQEAELVKQEADMATRYGPNHPKMLAIRNEKRDLASKIGREVQGIAGSLESDLEVARSHVGSIEASLARVTRQAREENMARVRLKALEGNLASTRSSYEAFVTRLRAVQDQDDIQLPEARVISSAPIPMAPSSPHRKLFIGAAIPGGLMLGILIALLLERFGNAVAPSSRRLGAPTGSPPASSPDAVPAFTATAHAAGFVPPPPRPPVLAELASSPDRRLADWVLDHPASPYATGLHTVLTSLVAMRSAHGLVVTLTAPSTDSSQSVAVLALARMAARAGLRTLVLDAHGGWLAPAVPASGLSAMLAGTPLATAVQVDTKSSACLLSAPPAVWGLPGTAGLMASLRQNCDLVLIDAARTSAAGVWPAVGQLSDAVLLLAPVRAPQGELDNALRSLVAMRAPLRGLVVMR